MNVTLTRPAVTDETTYENRAIARVTDVLRREFAARVPEELVPAAVAQAHARFSDAIVREFVPLMVERVARAWLAATGYQPDSARVGSGRP